MSDESDKRTPDMDPDAPASEEELAASKRLRDALEHPSLLDEGADLARSLRAAFAPTALDAAEHAAMIDDLPMRGELAASERLRDSLGKSDLVVALRAAWNPSELPADEHRAIVRHALHEARPSERGGRVIRVAFGVAAAGLALAASVLLWINAKPPSEMPIARARSTQPLFSEPFKPGDASARIDKIAVARASDYRNNRFAKWGVR